MTFDGNLISWSQHVGRTGKEASRDCQGGLGSHSAVSAMGSGLVGFGLLDAGSLLRSCAEKDRGPAEPGPYSQASSSGKNFVYVVYFDSSLGMCVT